MRFLVKEDRRAGSAGVLARNNVSCKRLSFLVGTPRRGVRGGLGETALPAAHLHRVWTFTLRAGTPELPAALRIKHALDSLPLATCRLLR